MKWTDFLTAISNSDSVTLVGPMNSEPHIPTGPTIYVDGGTRFATPGSTHPTVSVGDGDSGATVLDQLLPSAKDYSDLAYALGALPQSVVRVHLKGFLGGRRDHEYCNLGEVHAFLNGRSHFSTVEISDEMSHIVAFCKGRVTLEIQGPFSVLVLEPSAVKIAGACRFPMNRERVLGVFSSVGLSNEGYGVVEVESGSPAFLVLPN